MAKGFFSRFARSERAKAPVSEPVADPLPREELVAEVAKIVRDIAHQGLPSVPRKTAISLRLDAEVLDWFKTQGPGYQTRINAVLRAFMQAAG